MFCFTLSSFLKITIDPYEFFGQTYPDSFGFFLFTCFNAQVKKSNKDSCKTSHKATAKPAAKARHP
jgi:hypothetical protein